MGRPRSPLLAEAVISATIQLLAERGVEATTLDAIAAKAGVAKTSIYRRWASRDDLIADVFLHVTNRAVPVPDTGSLRGDLLSILTDIIDLLLSDAVGRASVALAAYAISHPEAVYNHLPLEKRREATTGVVERAIERGELPRDANADLILDLVSAPLYLHLLLWRRSVLGHDPEAIVDSVLYGVVKSDPPGAPSPHNRRMTRLDKPSRSKR
jgi:AcrR family transcriptional regulator